MIGLEKLTEKLSGSEKNRFEKWQQRQVMLGTCFKYSEVKLSDSGAAMMVDTELDLTQEEKEALADTTISAATGSANPDYARTLFFQMLNACIRRGSKDFVANSLNGALLALAPQDEIEGHLLSRLLLLHNNYMELLNRDDCEEENIQQVAELMRLYDESLAALCEYRSSKKECGA